MRISRTLLVAVGLLGFAAPAFCAMCIATPEPGTFWLAGVAGGGILMLRRFRSKK